ncbi:hypothetical protein BN1723_020846, partial [Verticillium longisporum]
GRPLADGAHGLRPRLSRERRPEDLPERRDAQHAVRPADPAPDGLDAERVVVHPRAQVPQPATPAARRSTRVADAPDGRRRVPAEAPE